MTKSPAWVLALALPVAVLVLGGGACRASRDRTAGAPAVAHDARVGTPLGARSDAGVLASAVDVSPAIAPQQAAITDASARDPGSADGGEPLTVEERERDPHSDEVTIKLQVDPPKRAHAFWGIKDLGVPPLEIRRPRGSGPLDLAIKAPGYLTIHTRAFTDRDDKVTIRMVPEAEAPRTFGYRAVTGR